MGQTKAQVTTAFGEPQRKAAAGPKEIFLHGLEDEGHFTNGKVSASNRHSRIWNQRRTNDRERKGYPMNMQLISRTVRRLSTTDSCRTPESCNPGKRHTNKPAPPPPPAKPAAAASAAKRHQRLRRQAGRQPGRRIDAEASYGQPLGLSPSTSSPRSTVRLHRLPLTDPMAREILRQRPMSPWETLRRKSDRGTYSASGCQGTVDRKTASGSTMRMRPMASPAISKCQAAWTSITA